MKILIVLRKLGDYDPVVHKVYRDDSPGDDDTSLIDVANRDVETFKKEFVEFRGAFFSFTVLDASEIVDMTSFMPKTVWHVFMGVLLQDKEIAIQTSDGEAGVVGLVKGSTEKIKNNPKYDPFRSYIITSWNGTGDVVGPERIKIKDHKSIFKGELP